MEQNDEPTLDASQTARGPLSTRALGLTVLWHPESERIGQIAPLFDTGRRGQAEVGRNAPIFRGCTADARTPLATPWVSRLPCQLQASHDGSVTLSVAPNAEVWLQGQRVTQPMTCSAGEIQRGVFLRLGRYVLLRLGMVELSAIGDPASAADRPDGPLARLIGNSPQMRELREEILRVADLDVAVMLRGETGVGKELVASALHSLSPRRTQPYICVNMGAIPSTMAASELFGHGKGAFTEAGGERQGYFADADGGTLFLDEIGETAADVQPMLLRVIEHGVIQPLGGRARQVDVRLIAATDSDLAAAIEAERFHGALLQRFGYEIRVPPLRDRGADIPQLFVHFLREQFAGFGEAWRLRPPGKRHRPWLPAHFVERLLRHRWPGNVRELRNAARRFAVYNRGRDQLVVDQRLLSMLELESSVSAPAPRPAPQRKAQELTEQEILEGLRTSGYEINRTARHLGVSRSWLHARMNGMHGVRKAKELSEAEIAEALAQADGDLERAAALLQVSARGLRLQLQRVGLDASARRARVRVE